MQPKAAKFQQNLFNAFWGPARDILHYRMVYIQSVYRRVYRMDVDHSTALHWTVEGYGMVDTHSVYQMVYRVDVDHSATSMRYTEWSTEWM